jgi:hypothetical protein
MRGLFMETNECVVVPDQFKGKTVEEVAITTKSVVIKFTDGTYFDIFLHPSEQEMKTSTNKLD